MRGVREVEAVHGAQLDAQRTDEAFGVGLAEAERRLEHEDIVVRTVDGGEDAVHVLELTAQPARLPRYTAYYGDTIRPTYYGYADYGDAMAMLAMARLPRRGCSALSLEDEVDPQEETAAAHVADQHA